MSNVNEWQPLLNGGFMFLTLLAGVVLKSIWGALNQLQKDLATLQDKLTSDYVRRDDFYIVAAQIRETLTRIENKLDGKVDK